MGTTAVRRERIRAVLSVLLAFLLSLFLTLFTLVLLVQATVMSPSYFRNQVARSQYVPHLIEDMEDYFVSYGETSGFDEAFFTTVLDETAVQTDIVREIDRLYGSGGTGADIPAFRDSLYRKLVQNVEARQITITDDIDAALQYLVKICAETYQEGVGLPLASYAAGAVSAMRKPLLFALLGLGVLSLFAGGFLFIIQPVRRQALRYLSYALGGAMLMVAVPAVWLLSSGRIERIGITGKALYHLVVTYLQQTGFAALWAAVILAVLTLGTMLLHLVFARRASGYAPRHAGGAESGDMA